MANPLFSILNTKSSPIMSAINMARQIAGNNPQAAYQMLLRTNPAFAQFVNVNYGKSAEQIASEHGIDLAQVMSMIK